MTELPEYNIAIEPDKQMRIEYMPVSAVMKLLWRRNPKLHADKDLVESIRRYGFQASPKLDDLINGGEDGVVFGNGRTIALCALMKESLAEGDDPPLNIDIENGEWIMPVLVGNNQGSQEGAEALALDHNFVSASAADVGVEEMAQMVNPVGFKQIVSGWEDSVKMATLTGLEIQSIAQNAMDAIGAAALPPAGNWNLNPPDDDTPDFDSKPLPDTSASIDGIVRFSISRDVYTNWLEEMRQTVSFVEDEIHYEILRRLGIVDYMEDEDVETEQG